LWNHDEANITDKRLNSAVFSQVTFDIAYFVKHLITVLIPASIVDVLSPCGMVIYKKGFIVIVLPIQLRVFFLNILNVVLLEWRNYCLRWLCFLKIIAQSFSAGIELHIFLNNALHVVELDHFSIILPDKDISHGLSSLILLFSSVGIIRFYTIIPIFLMFFNRSQ
jgi:hypothetical protein